MRFIARILPLICSFGASIGLAQTNGPATASVTNRPSLFRSPEDNRLDVSRFLDQRYGFLPLAVPITEPAVGYGAAGGLAFISSPLGDAAAGHGRPNITFVGGLGTDNG